jgi:hypothetical protein
MIDRRVLQGLATESHRGCSESHRDDSVVLCDFSVALCVFVAKDFPFLRPTEASTSYKGTSSDLIIFRT